MKLALLPPASVTPWWSALVRGLVDRDDIDLLWVAATPPEDQRVPWLALDPDASSTSRASSPSFASVGTGTPAMPGAVALSSTPPAALIVDVDSPRAGLVAPLASELPLLAVIERREDAAADVFHSENAQMLLSDAHLIVCVDRPPAAADASMRARLRRVPLAMSREGIEVGPGRVDGVPSVAVMGDVHSDEVRLVWARIAQHRPNAVLVGQLDEHDPETRTRILANVDVVVVLDTSGSNLAEALASGATVLAHGDAKATALITHGVDGLLTDGRAPDLLAGAVDYALRYHDQLAEMRAASVAAARRHFSGDTLAARVVQLLAELPGHDAAATSNDAVSWPERTGSVAYATPEGELSA